MNIETSKKKASAQIITIFEMSRLGLSYLSIGLHTVHNDEPDITGQQKWMETFDSFSNISNLKHLYKLPPFFAPTKKFYFSRKSFIIRNLCMTDRGSWGRGRINRYYACENLDTDSLPSQILLILRSQPCLLLEVKLPYDPVILCPFGVLLFFLFLGWTEIW